jgi:hypothetical protein
MVYSSFVKKIFPSNLGKSGMHDKYITVPQKTDPKTFFGHPPRIITCIDKISRVHYNFPYTHAANGEFRLTQFGPYFDNKNAKVNDEIVIEKFNSGNSIFYTIDLLKNEVVTSPIYYFSPDKEDDDPKKYYLEGSIQSVLINKYERNIKAREKCIEHYGVSCKACGLDFKKEYGQIGEGFIHVHHLIPVSDIGESYKVDPINDLIPVCPNCHAMIHKREPPYSIEEIKVILNQ